MRTRRLAKWVLFNLCLGILVGSIAIFPFHQGTGETNLMADISNIGVASVLNEGADLYTLVFVTGGAAGWFYTDNTYYYGEDSIQSGAIGNLQSSYVQTVVTGPGSIQFRWMVLSEINCDTLKFYIDSTLMNSISGFVEWQLNNYSIGSGGHTLKWEYAKDGAFSYYSDCGWIDDVRWFGPTTAILYDDITLHGYYNISALNYFYQTDVLASSYYHCVWLQAGAPSDNFDLYLYSDASYSNLTALSTREAGNLDWVLLRPCISQPYYPKTERNLGSGDAYIQWEDSSTVLSIESTYSGTINSSECIELYTVHLSRGLPYRFTLNVPATGDYDLYLYSLSGAAATNHAGYSKCSRNIGNGTSEMISAFIPSISDYFAVIVVWKGGSGIYNLTWSVDNTLLSNDITVKEKYDFGSVNYYQTGIASSSYFHCVWLRSDLSSNDFNLYLFSDYTYSTLKTASTRGSGLLDWVIFRPSSTQAFYPKTNISAGSGTAYIQWEDSSTSLSIGSTYSGAVNASECIDIYKVTFPSSSNYNIILDVPSGADYDLYLYRLGSGGATGYSGYYQKSETIGSGLDEIISTYVYSMYDYAILVTWKSGSGPYYLTIIKIGSLPDDSSRYAYYNSNTSYYYQTGYATSGYDYCVWLKPTTPSVDFNLYLYSDSSFSTLEASSTRGAGDLEWVMFNPTTTKYYYPKVQSYSASGYGYIQCEEGSTFLSIGINISGSVSSSDCIEIYGIYLATGYTYNIELDVPSSGDYDLFLYYLNSGSSISYSGFSRCSAIVGNGYDELIGAYTPSISGFYVIVIAWMSGSGSYYLRISDLTLLPLPSNLPPPLYMFLISGVIRGCILCGIIIIRIVKRMKKSSSFQKMP